MENRGLLHIYTGDGKGKTTAAIGLSVRAKGAGKRVLIAQFLKGGKTSELEPLAQLGIAVLRTEAVKKFTFQMDEEEKALCKKDCIELLERVHTSVVDRCCGLVVLDEVLDAIRAGMLEEEQLLRLLDARGETEVVITGRAPSEELRRRADYLTAMTAEKHPYQLGLPARLGIEY